MAGGREACFDTICEEWISPRETQQAQPQRPSAITGCTVNCPSILLSGGWLPGKVGTKFMATPDVAGGVTISGLYVCWSLGPKRRRRLVWRNFHQKKEKKKQNKRTEQTVTGDPRGLGDSWERTSLELASKKRPAKAALGHLASGRSVRSPWTGGWGEWRDSPPEKGFQQDSPFLRWDLEKAPDPREMGGWVGRVGIKER